MRVREGCLSFALTLTLILTLPLTPVLAKPEWKDKLNTMHKGWKVWILALKLWTWQEQGCLCILGFIFSPTQDILIKQHASLSMQNCDYQVAVYTQTKWTTYWTSNCWTTKQTQPFNQLWQCGDSRKIVLIVGMFVTSQQISTVKWKTTTSWCWQLFQSICSIWRCLPSCYRFAACRFCKLLLWWFRPGIHMSKLLKTFQT